MMRAISKILLITIGLLIISYEQKVYSMNEHREIIWDMDVLSKTPKIHPAPGLEPLGSKAIFYDGIMCSSELKEADSGNHNVKAIFYEGEPFRGKPTRIFAYYGIPDAPKGTKLPAMVLVHGGGGTAFESWVRLWNARGYAAIAMDTCGSVPVGEYGNWERHEFSGPPGWGGIDQTKWPLKDQWTYHAVADVILAHSLLRSFPQVDSEKIGLTGISWGGYLTCIVAGVDHRFKFAVPVYGCGYYGESLGWKSFLEETDPENAKWWLATWDPSNYLKSATMPMLWVNGTNDFAYHLNAWQKSYRTAKGPRTLCLKINMLHGHGGAGENPEEIHGYANSLCKGEPPLVSIEKQGRIKDTVWVRYKSAVPIKKAELIFTQDTGNWVDRKWEACAARIKDGLVSATIPQNAAAYFVNIIDDRDYTVSSEHVEIQRKEEINIGKRN